MEHENKKEIIPENQTIAAVTQHFQNQLEELKKRHEEEIKEIRRQLDEEKNKHIQDIKDILTVGKIQIPQNESEATEEERITNQLRLKFNLKGVK